LGIDLTSLSRISSMYRRRGNRFLQKYLSPREFQDWNELQDCDERKQTQFLASRWAVKEALLKAMGERILFPELTLISRGQPILKFEGVLEKRSQELGISKAFTSISHDGDYVVACVVLWKEKITE